MKILVLAYLMLPFVALSQTSSEKQRYQIFTLQSDPLGSVSTTYQSSNPSGTLKEQTVVLLDTWTGKSWYLAMNVFTDRSIQYVWVPLVFGNPKDLQNVVPPELANDH